MADKQTGQNTDIDKRLATVAQQLDRVREALSDLERISARRRASAEAKQGRLRRLHRQGARSHNGKS